MGFREQYVLREKQRSYAEMADEMYRNHVAQQAWSGYGNLTLKPVGGVYVAPADDAKFDKQIDGEVVR